MLTTTDLRALAIGAHVSLAGFLYGLDTGECLPYQRSILPHDSERPPDFA